MLDLAPEMAPYAERESPGPPGLEHRATRTAVRPPSFRTARVPTKLEVPTQVQPGRHAEGADRGVAVRTAEAFKRFFTENRNPAEATLALVKAAMVGDLARAKACFDGESGLGPVTARLQWTVSSTADRATFSAGRILETEGGAREQTYAYFCLAPLLASSYSVDRAGRRVAPLPGAIPQTIRLGKGTSPPPTAAPAGSVSRP